MGNATSARQRAQGLIGQGRVQKLYEEGKLIILFATDYERLTQRLAELEKANALLREIAAESAAINGVAAQVLREAMRG